jgi:hypothetical protein
MLALLVALVLGVVGYYRRRVSALAKFQDRHKPLSNFEREALLAQIKQLLEPSSPTAPGSSKG